MQVSRPSPPTGRGAAELAAEGPRTAPLTLITPPKAWAWIRLGELREYRELLFFLVWRDVKVRYRQTVLGAAWAVIQPLMMMIVFSLFLGRLAGVKTAGVPYPIATYAALVPWLLFSQSMSGASDSLVSSSGLVSKVYFPRLILPIAAAGSYLLDFLISFVLLVGMMVYYGIYPSGAIGWLPLLTLLALLTAFSVGIWLSALNVRFRDVKYAVPFLVQLWLFATPVAYPSSLVPERYRDILGLNPMAGVVEGFRWALLGTDTHPGRQIAISAAVTVVLLAGGLLYFQKVERTFADVI